MTRIEEMLYRTLQQVEAAWRAECQSRIDAMWAEFEAAREPDPEPNPREFQVGDLVRVNEAGKAFLREHWGEKGVPPGPVAITQNVYISDELPTGTIKLAGSGWVNPEHLERVE